jgi:hypothetical protein
MKKSSVHIIMEMDEHFSMDPFYSSISKEKKSIAHHGNR